MFSDSESNSGAVKFHEVTCPSGKVATGGGGSIQDVNPSFVSMSESRPDPGDPAKWHVTGAEVNPASIDWAVRAYAVCATVAE